MTYHSVKNVGPLPEDLCAAQASMTNMGVPGVQSPSDGQSYPHDSLKHLNTDTLYRVGFEDCLEASTDPECRNLILG